MIETLKEGKLNIEIHEMLNQIDRITQKQENGIFDKNGSALDEEITYFNNLKR